MRKVPTVDDIVIKEVISDLTFANDPSYFPEKLYDTLFKMDFINSIQKLYPNAKDWITKVSSEIKNGDGSHRLFYMRNIKTKYVYGFYIIKDDKVDNMKKICTLFVFNQYRNRGLGKVLLKDAVSKLNYSKDNMIYLTVANCKFKRLLYFFMDSGFCYWDRRRNFYKRESIRNIIDGNIRNSHLGDEHIFVYKNASDVTYQ